MTACNTTCIRTLTYDAPTLCEPFTFLYRQSYKLGITLDSSKMPRNKYHMPISDGFSYDADPRLFLQYHPRRSMFITTIITSVGAYRIGYYRGLSNENVCSWIPCRYTPRHCNYSNQRVVFVSNALAPYIVFSYLCRQTQISLASAYWVLSGWTAMKIPYLGRRKFMARGMQVDITSKRPAAVYKTRHGYLCPYTMKLSDHLYHDCIGYFQVQSWLWHSSTALRPT